MTNVGLTLSDMICLKEGWISGAADGQVVKMKLISIEAVEPGFDIYLFRDRDGNQLDIRPVGEAAAKQFLLHQQVNWADFTVTAKIDDFELLRSQNKMELEGGCFLLKNFEIQKGKLVQSRFQKKALMQIEEEREIIQVPPDAFSNPQEKIQTLKIPKKKLQNDMIGTERVVQAIPLTTFTKFVENVKELQQHVGGRVNFKGVASHVSNLYQSSRSYFHFKLGSSDTGFVNVILFDKVAVETYKEIQQDELYEIYGLRCQRDRRDNTVELVIDNETKLTRIHRQQPKISQPEEESIEVCTYDQIQRMYENSENGNIPYFNIIGTVKYIDDLGSKRKLVIEDNRHQQLTVIVWNDHGHVPIRRGDEYLFRGMRVDKNKAQNTFNGVCTIKSTKILHDPSDHWRDRIKLKLKISEREEPIKKKRDYVVQVESEKPRQSINKTTVCAPELTYDILPPVGSIIEGRLQFSFLKQPLKLSDFVSLSCEGCTLNNELAAKLINSQFRYGLRATFTINCRLNSHKVKLSHQTAETLMNSEAIHVAELILNGNHVRIINRLQIIQLQVHKFQVLKDETIQLCDLVSEDCLRQLEKMGLKIAQNNKTQVIEVEQDGKSQSSHSV